MQLGLLVVMAGLAMGQKGSFLLRGDVPGGVHPAVGLKNILFNTSTSLKKISSDEGCFPGRENKGCPPAENTRIVPQKYHDLTTQADYNACWNHCKSLANAPRCYAWTFIEKANPTMNCFTYTSFPPCYTTRSQKGWYSGQSSC